MSKRWWWLAAAGLAALVGWSLIQQAQREATVGEKVAAGLVRHGAEGVLRGAIPVLEYEAGAGKKWEQGWERLEWPGGKAEEWRRGSFSLLRVMAGEGALARRRIRTEKAKGLEEALGEAGYAFGKPTELVGAARERLAGLSDEALLERFLRADRALLARAEDAAAATELGVLLTTWDLSGISVRWRWGDRRVYVLEGRGGRGAAGDERQEVNVVCLNGDGSERWHGLARWGADGAGREAGGISMMDAVAEAVRHVEKER